MHGWLVCGSLRAVDGGKTMWVDKVSGRGYFELLGTTLTKRIRELHQAGGGGGGGPAEGSEDDNAILERYIVVSEAVPEGFPVQDKDRVLVVETEDHGQLVLFGGTIKDAAKWRSALAYAVSKERIFPESGPGVQRWISQTRKALKSGLQTVKALKEMFEREPPATERVLDDAQGGTMLHVAARCHAALMGGEFMPPAVKPKLPPGQEEEWRDPDIFYIEEEVVKVVEEKEEKPRSLMEIIWEACPERCRLHACSCVFFSSACLSHVMTPPAQSHPHLLSSFAVRWHETIWVVLPCMYFARVSLSIGAVSAG